MQCNVIHSFTLWTLLKSTNRHNWPFDVRNVVLKVQQLDQSENKKKSSQRRERGRKRESAKNSTSTFHALNVCEALCCIIKSRELFSHPTSRERHCLCVLCECVAHLHQLFEVQVQCLNNNNNLFSLASIWWKWKRTIALVTWFYVPRRGNNRVWERLKKNAFWSTIECTNLRRRFSTTVKNGFARRASQK